MGWGGSVQTMINTLKANKDLLKQRRKLFEREPQFGKVRRRYTKASQALLNEKPPSKEVLDQIRQKLKKDRKREILIMSLTAVLVTFFTSVLGFAVYRNLMSTVELENYQNSEFNKAQQLSEYWENMQIGKNQMENHNFFFAIGSFGQALSLLPNDSLAEYQLAYAYCMQCSTNKKGCDKAAEFIQSMINKHPNSVEFELLKTNYLLSPRKP